MLIRPCQYEYLHLVVSVSRAACSGHTGDHLEGEERTLGLVDDGQSSHSVLVEEVRQEGMVAEETRHSGLAHPALAHIQVAQLLAPEGQIFTEAPAPAILKALLSFAPIPPTTHINFT